MSSIQMEYGMFNNIESECDMPNCNVPNMLATVAQRKTVQFVTEPRIQAQPVVISDLTTIFQVEGNSAKLAELKDPNQPFAMPKTIYRIVPNTHAHIVNYVVVENDSDSLRQFADESTLVKLLDSQRISAEHMLNRLMEGNGMLATHSPLAMTGGGLPLTPPSPPYIHIPSPHASTVRTVMLQPPGRPIKQAPESPSTSNTVSTISPSCIKLPMRTHPNLKITAVLGADGASTNFNSHIVAGAKPIITPVPLANLRPKPPVPLMMHQVAPPNPQFLARAPVYHHLETAEKQMIDKLHAELQELRRTVTMLAEAHSISSLADGRR